MYKVAALLMLAMMLAACGRGNGQGGGPAPSADRSGSGTAAVGETAPSAAGEASGGSASDGAAAGNAETPLYFGEWTVRAVVGSTPIATAADDSLIGMKAAYSWEGAAFGGETVRISDWTHPGNVLIIKDGQTIILLWDGNYYEMKRV